MSKEVEFNIIKRVIKGDVTAFESLVDKHKQFVFSIVMNILKSREDAEEVAMDVFIKAYQKIDSFHFESKFSTWLYTIAYRQALMLLRKKGGQLEELKEHHHLAVYPFTDKIHQSEQRIIIEEALKTLSLEDKTIMTLFYLHELSLKEIEEITDIKAETVKVKIHRSRKKLQQILLKKLPEFEINNLI